MVDESTVASITTRVCSDADKKLDAKIQKQLQLLERDMRQEFTAKLKTLEELLRKELNYMVLQNSLKKGIDDNIYKRTASFVPQPNQGIDEM